MRGLSTTSRIFIDEAQWKNANFQSNFWMLCINGIVAGFFIALTGFIYQKILTLTGNLVLASCAVPLGFILCDTFQADLFSTHFLYALAAYAKRQKWREFALSALCVTLFNIFGIIIFILIIWGSGQIPSINIIAGQEIARKIDVNIWSTFLRGCIGGLASCMGVFTARRTDSAGEKVLSIWISIFSLSVCGFEHATLDFYYFLLCPNTGIMGEYFPKLVFVYFGNLIGGLIFSGLITETYRLKHIK